MDITIYFVGVDRDDALTNGFPFDSVDAAEDYIDSEGDGWLLIFRTTVTVEPSDLEIV